jgi:hypothetical protein
MVSGDLMWWPGLCGITFQEVFEMNNLFRHLKGTKDSFIQNRISEMSIDLDL